MPDLSKKETKLAKKKNQTGMEHIFNLSNQKKIYRSVKRIKSESGSCSCLQAEPEPEPSDSAGMPKINTIRQTGLPFREPGREQRTLFGANCIHFVQGNPLDDDFVELISHLLYF
jgi:hypothetical protein